MFKDAWGQRVGQMEADKRLILTERNQLAKKIEGLLDRIVDADNPTLIKAYEKRIEKMEREKLILDEKVTLLRKSVEGQGSPFPRRTYPTASVTGMPSAVNPFMTATRS
ncbi:hypothetical protein K3725_13775 [Leisingera sp. S132]|uniref:hypothetical protein n=1 Tax=Leisingera sp. S132 TaxID=2867016 RepID=UPI0021A7CD5D|nr:hypothetical protein [Leisingera sp. S132]UWQ78375.1 hypothetical protein K3725_13775 [Leisingera sp. S132]